MILSENETKGTLYLKYLFISEDSTTSEYGQIEYYEGYSKLSKNIVLKKYDVGVVDDRIVIHSTAEGKTNIYRFKSEKITRYDWGINSNPRYYELSTFKEETISVQTKDGF